MFIVVFVWFQNDMTSNGIKEIKKTTAHHSNNNIHQNGSLKKNANPLIQSSSSVRRPMRSNNMAIKRRHSVEPRKYFCSFS